MRKLIDRVCRKPTCFEDETPCREPSHEHGPVSPGLHVRRYDHDLLQRELVEDPLPDADARFALDDRSFRPQQTKEVEVLPDRTPRDSDLRGGVASATNAGVARRCRAPRSSSSVLQQHAAQPRRQPPSPAGAHRASRPPTRRGRRRIVERRRRPHHGGTESDWAIRIRSKGERSRHRAFPPRSPRSPSSCGSSPVQSRAHHRVNAQPPCSRWRRSRM